MRSTGVLTYFLVAVSLFGQGVDRAELQARRHHAASVFHDGILLVHAASRLDSSADGFRQDPAFYYFTGLENTPSALLAIDGQSGQSWLFLNVLTHSAALAESMDPRSVATFQAEVLPGSDAAARLGVEHVEDWSALSTFLTSFAKANSRLYYVPQRFSLEELPPSFGNLTVPAAPLWATTLTRYWPNFQLKSAGTAVFALMGVQSAAEMVSLRRAAQATVPAILAGMRAIKPGVSQRSAEVAVADACWQQGRGVSFWPWVMAGEKGIFPYPWVSFLRYDHLDGVMRSGDLVRLDVGCEWEHYQGDLGRTVPVSGRYTEEQAETWNIFVASYQAGVKMLREGITQDQVVEAWRKELVSHRSSAKTAMAQHAIESWAKPENTPFLGLHTMNLDAGFVDGPLRSGMTIDFEPIASIDGQGFYLEDMFLITKDGADLLTPGVPYTTQEIEAVMGGR